MYLSTILYNEFVQYKEMNIFILYLEVEIG